MNFSNLQTIFRRELSAYFNVAIAYIFIIVFVLLNGTLYMTQIFLYGVADMRPFFSILPIVLCVFLPAVTMRLWAEEKRGNTLELLLTFPMPTHTLVIGKFLASFIFYLVALAGTLTLPVMLRVIGHPDMGAIAGGYIGAVLLGALFLAVGIFISGLCRDQIVAFIVSMLICFGLHLAGTELMASSIDGWIPGFGSFLRYFIGASQHYTTFQKGVIDNGDVLYFLIGTVVFLVLNGFWLEGRMKSGAKKIFTLATIICAGIFLMSNWLLADLPLGRFDLSEGQIYTIAPATRKILRDLSAPVTAKFYVSSVDKMPTGMKTLEQDVVDKLEEFRVVSGGKFQFKLFHMDAANVTEPGSRKEGKDSLEEQLQRKGIHPFQVRAVESDEVNVRLVYAAVSLGYKEKSEEVIPQIMPDNLHELEYLLISKIYKMNMEKIPRIALVAPYEEKKLEPQVADLLKQLGGQIPESYREDAYELLPLSLKYEGYEVERIHLDKDQPIPEDASTLVVVEPRELNARQRYEINKFLVRGGRVFLAVQNYEYSYQPSGNQLSIFSDEKKPQVNDSLLREWGLEVDDQILLDEQHDVINLSGGARLGPFDISVPVKLPIQILVTASGMNPEVSITSRLSSLFYLWGTALKIDQDKVKSNGLKVQTLLHSSPDSWTVPFRGGSFSPRDFVRQPESRTGPFPLAVLVTGKFPDAFKGKVIPDWPDKEEPAKPEAAAQKPVKTVSTEKSDLASAEGKLVLIGAATLFQKHLARGGGNLFFFMNAVDAISLGDELVTIRSKQPTSRALGRISPAAKMGWRIFVTFLVPLLFAMIGSICVFLRRQAKNNYMKKFAMATA